ncbi:MAG: type IX secretion system membrane protein PorP/SprF [Bacteroidales bacterium]|nr:type IX secretion system membrane protein PorP/SprF [Bacteroidales bacterium]
MKKFIFLLVIGCLVLVYKGSAQQLPVSSIFIENPFLFNPAVAGVDDGFKVRMNNRFQWLGFADAPITNLLSAYGPHKNKNIGYGGTIGYDSAGPYSKFNLNGAFATNVSINDQIRISMGIGLGFIQYRIDGSQLELDAPGTPQIQDPYAPLSPMSTSLPDASAGVYVYHNNWYAGFSALQLFNNNVVFNGENSDRNRLKTHFYVNGGYKFVLNEQWEIEPALLVKKVDATPLQLDLTGRVTYRQQFWGGINLRNTFESFEDISIMIGYIHQKNIHIGLAYDHTLAKIGKFNSGTIELVLGYNFTSIKNRPKSDK